MQSSDLQQKYPWLKLHAGKISEYIPPDYYNRILKEYTFNSIPDLRLFSNYLNSKIKPLSTIRALELGFGSGRTTDVFLKHIPAYTSLSMVDLSQQMIDYSQKKYRDKRNISFIHSDAIEYFSNVKLKYDFVYSLWSFSHSVHQHLIDDSSKSEYVKNSMLKFIRNNLKSKGKLYIFHFDSQSEEQTILFKQWKKVFPIFRNTNIQSPSKLLIDEVFNICSQEKIGKISLTHLIGDPIRYKSMDEALETFMNFHMETYFNKSTNVKEIIYELRNDLSFYQKEDGIYIKPGCFIYEFEKK